MLCSTPKLPYALNQPTFGEDERGARHTLRGQRLCNPPEGLPRSRAAWAMTPAGDLPHHPEERGTRRRLSTQRCDVCRPRSPSLPPSTSLEARAPFPRTKWLRAPRARTARARAATATTRMAMERNLGTRRHWCVRALEQNKFTRPLGPPCPPRPPAPRRLLPRISPA